MSEDEKAKITEHEEPQDEVEAHKGGHMAANDEGSSEGDDDVEAHKFHKNRPGKMG
jgi:hypothetical protein